MLTDKIFIGLLASFFCLGLADAVVAGNNEKPSGFSGDQVISMYMDNHGIEFGYSPMVESRQITAVSPVYENNEDIEPGYSPIVESDQMEAVSRVYMNGENIEFDYSPRVENSQMAVASPVDMNDKKIEFDNSPRVDSDEADFEGTGKPIVVCAASLIDTLSKNQADYCRRMLGI